MALGAGTGQTVRLERPHPPAEFPGNGGAVRSAQPWSAPTALPPQAPVRGLPTNVVITAAVVVLLAVGGMGFFLVIWHTHRDSDGISLRWGSNEAPDGSEQAYPFINTPSETPETMVDSPEPPTTMYPSTAEYPPLVLFGNYCGRPGVGPYAEVASGNDHTTCPFSLNVRDSFVQSGYTGATISIEAYSPAMERWYVMQCSGNQPVTCTGGDDAVVYNYGGTATFTG